jgi:hypothetical protein
MWTPSDRLPGRAASPPRLLRALALGILFATGALLATDAAFAQQPAAPAGDRAELRRTLEQRYEALPVHGGVLLKPRVEKLGVRSIEVSGDTISVNGEAVPAGVLRSWLGGDADPLLRLKDFAPAERRKLFGLEPEAGAAALPVPPAATATTSDTSATPSTTGDEEPETSEVPAPPAAPAPPEPPSAPLVDSGSIVRMGRGVTVSRGERAEQVVVIGGSVRIDGEVSDNVAAIGGAVRVNGRVGGDVAAVGGKVYLGPHAEVMGDVASVGGSIERDPGARVHGSSSEAAGIVPGLHWHRDFDDWPFVSRFGRLMNFIWSLMSLVLTALLVCLVLAIGRGLVERVDARLVAEPGKSFLVGFAAPFVFFMLLLMVSFLLLITIVGCLFFLLYPFLFLAVIVALLVGYSVSCYRLGRLLEARFHLRLASPYAAALLGVGVLGAGHVLARLFSLGGGFFFFFAFVFGVIGLLAQMTATAMGMGALLLTWQAERQQRLRALPGPGGTGSVPPPAPVEPPPPVHPGEPPSPPSASSLPEGWERPPSER